MAQLHATTVAIEGQGMMILGPSGSGKSGLALQLMAVGAQLVADDRTDVMVRDGRLIASAPQALLGMIEARGVGILKAEVSPPVPLALVVDLGRVEDQRLPPPRWYGLGMIRLPLVFGPWQPHLYAALRQRLLHGRAE